MYPRAPAHLCTAVPSHHCLGTPPPWDSFRLTTEEALSSSQGALSLVRMVAIPLDLSFPHHPPYPYQNLLANHYILFKLNENVNDFC